MSNGARPDGSETRRLLKPLLRLVAQAELHLHLVMPDLAVIDVAADFRHLEPFEMAQRLRRSSDTVFDRFLEGIAGAADYFGDAVNMVAHRSLHPFRLRPKHGAHRLRCP